MYIDINTDPRRRTILPFPGRRDPYEERDPRVKPHKPFPRPPFIPKVPIPTDDEYPVSKDEFENEAREKEKTLHESIMKNARRNINRGLRAGQRTFAVEEVDNRIRNKEINMLITEYKAAGWKVVHSKEQRPSDPTDGWNNLEFS